MELKESLPPTGKPLVFLLVVFAIGYLLSSLLRGVTAALAPIFIQQFNVSPAELGLLAGSYFASFALLQLPMGMYLDRFGVRMVMIVSLLIAAASCVLFAASMSFSGLFWARLLSGVGVSACLIAPLTAARLWATSSLQQRINSWMLMAGALGLVLGTLPAESLSSTFGWPVLFNGLGVSFAIISLLIGIYAPRHVTVTRAKLGFLRSYQGVVRSVHTWKIGAIGFLNYAILVAVQTLWIGPWLTNVVGDSTRGASVGLLNINLIMLGVFFLMGYLSPKFIKSADDAETLLRRCTPVSTALLMVLAVLGPNAQWYHFALYVVAAWPLSVTHPLIGQRFNPNEAGRAIAFFNLLLFLGVFIWQWGFGALVSVLEPSHGTALSYQFALGALAALSGVGYTIFIAFRSKTTPSVAVSRS